MIMRIARGGIAAGILFSIALAGCGGEPENVPFKATDTSQFDDMKNMMIKNVKSKNYKGVTPPKETAAKQTPAKETPAEETPAN